VNQGAIILFKGANIELKNINLKGMNESIIYKPRKTVGQIQIKMENIQVIQGTYFKGHNLKVTIKKIKIHNRGGYTANSLFQCDI
jgi:uncharacterized lipoprotein YehR (DUF1307 family)